jgi:hypothetical protein
MAAFAQPSKAEPLRIDKSKTYCLNEDPAFKHDSLFMGDASLPLKSDADEQLLLQVGFPEVVSLDRLEIGLPPIDDPQRPTTLKLYCNKLNMGFDDDSKPTQTYVVKPEDGENLILKMATVFWTRTEALTIFVEDNCGSDVSRMHHLRIYGEAVMGVKVDENFGKSC